MARRLSRSFLFDGMKAQSIDNLDQWIERQSEQGDTHKVYSAVPTVYRCVQLRANAVSRVPHYIMRNEEPIEYPLEYMMPQLLWKTEAAICLYASSYWLRAKNRVNVEGFRWLLPSSIKIVADEQEGLKEFIRRVGALDTHYTPEQLVHFWLPALDKEIGPGVAPVQAALTMAGVSLNSNEFAAQFFQRGAIPATLLTVEGNPPDPELRRLEEWWKRLLGGVKRAWETVAIRAGVTVQTIQQPMKDLAMVEINDSARRQIALALGVPVTLLEDSANYATASAHWVQFYTETIAPECELLATVLNEQVFKPQGLEFKFAINELDVMQTDESDRAASLNQLVGAKLPLVLAMQILGYDLPEGWTWERLEEETKPEPVPEVLQPFAGQNNKPGSEAAAAVDEANAAEAQAKAELGAWRRYAVKHGATKAQEFGCEYLQADVADVIRKRLQIATGAEEVKAAFSGPFLKAASDAELRIMKRLQRTFTIELDKLMQTLGDPPDMAALSAWWPEHEAALLATLRPEIERVAQDGIAKIVAGGLGVDWGLVAAEAARWASEYTYQLVKRITDTTRKVLQQKVSDFFKEPGRTTGDLMADLKPFFGEVRAESIAVTEVTRASVQGEVIAVQEATRTGQRMQAIFQTNNDDLVCPICEPLNGKPVGPENYPPLHPRCRCGLSHEWVR